MSNISSIANIHKAYKLIKESPLVIHTRLEKNNKLSAKYKCNLFLKREDLQTPRTFKVRGALNQIIKMTQSNKDKGVVAASDGTFSVAIAYLCNSLKIKCHLFIPVVTFKNKQEKIIKYGVEYVNLHLEGNSFEESSIKAQEFAQQQNLTLLHPFDNDYMIEGNATIGMEIMDDMSDIDYIICPVGGGGLIAGIISAFKQLSPDTKVIGSEPYGAARMTAALLNGSPIGCESISRFCDSSSLKIVGQKPFKIIQNQVEQIVVVDEGKIATTILNLYELGIIVEPAGALAVSALDSLKDQIQGKNIVCIMTGSFSDLSRLEQIREMSLIYEGLKTFFLINFPLRQGILKEFVEKCLGPTDEISSIQFNKKANREQAPSLVAIDVQHKNDIDIIKNKMTQMHLEFTIVNDNKELYDLLV